MIAGSEGDMLKVNDDWLRQAEAAYPGFQKTLMHYESAALPACTACRSSNTAAVSGGVIGRTIALAAATTKMKLLPNADGTARHFCNDCEQFF